MFIYIFLYIFFFIYYIYMDIYIICYFKVVPFTWLIIITHGVALGFKKVGDPGCITFQRPIKPYNFNPLFLDTIFKSWS